MLHCIQECTSCHAVCLHTSTVAVYADGLPRDNALIRTLHDCTEICQMCADFLLRGSMLYGITCDACARICEACASACENYPDNANFRACASSCRTCAAACHATAASAPNWRDQISAV
jgi:hypothetical protein